MSGGGVWDRPPVLLGITIAAVLLAAVAAVAWGSHHDRELSRRARLAPAVTIYEDGSGWFGGEPFCLTGYPCDDERR